MEPNDTKITRKEIIQIAFTIVLAITVGVLLFTVIVVIKNIEEIKSDPVNYAIENTPLESCSCFDGEGNYHNYPKGTEPVFYIGSNRLGEIGDLKLAKEK